MIIILNNKLKNVVIVTAIYFSRILLKSKTTKHLLPELTASCIIGRMDIVICSLIRSKKTAFPHIVAKQPYIGDLNIKRKTV